MVYRHLGLSCLIVLLSACGGTTSSGPDGGDGAASDIGASDLGAVDLGRTDARVDGSAVCTADHDCDDGVYCNGAEGCNPADTRADSRGCVTSATGPCLAGQTCDEAGHACMTTSCMGAAGDADGDGHRAIACGGDDCDDADPNRYPGHAEICDASNHDEDCDTRTFGLRDLDGDGDPDAQCCNVDGATMHCGTDCDDTRASVNPAAPEVCNLRDDNCDGMTDEGVQRAFYADADHDLYGDASGSPTMACTPPPGTVEDHTDCDDADAGRNPGLMEICDALGTDEDCNAATVPVCSCTGTMTRGCTAPGACMAGIQTCSGGTWGACSIGPVAETCNGVDDNCNGTTDEGVTINCYADDDDDGYALVGAATSSPCPDSDPTRVSRGGCPPGLTNRAPTDTANADCNDGQASINPGVAEICNGTDENCNGAVDEGVTTTYYADCDNDGRGTSATSGVTSCGIARTVADCTLPTGYSANSVDCNDMQPTVYGGSPAAMELCDGLDNNCNGLVDEGVSMLTFYRDADGDGWVTTMAMMACTAPPGYIIPVPAHDPIAHPNEIDCNDTDPLIHPEAAQGCMGDTDCNPATLPVTPTWYVDCDGDNYSLTGAASMTTCTQPTTATGCAGGGGQWQSTNPPSVAADCLDTVATVHPGASEACDGYNTDCVVGISGGSGLDYPSEDVDQDGYASLAVCGPATGGEPPRDCNDSVAGIHPTAAEIVADGIDQNCDGLELCYGNVDNDGYRTSTTVSTSDIACLGTNGHARSTVTAGDCCDTDNRAHPGQLGWFTTSRSGCAGYDFNCDGASTKQDPSLSTISCTFDTGPPADCFASGAPGWVTTVPACGASGTYYDDCLLSSTGRTCVRVPGAGTVQACH